MLLFKIVLEFLKSELIKTQIIVSQKESGREALEFNVKVVNNIYYSLSLLIMKYQEVLKFQNKI